MLLSPHACLLFLHSSTPCILILWTLHSGEQSVFLYGTVCSNPDWGSCNVKAVWEYLGIMQGVLASLLRSGATPSGILHPALDSSGLRKTQTYWSGSTGGLQKQSEAWNSLLWESWSCSSWRRECFWERIKCSLSCLKGACKNQRTRDNGFKFKEVIFRQERRILFMMQVMKHLNRLPRDR